VIASMPEALFKTSGKGGTHTKVCILIGTKKQPEKQFDIFMGEARWCGHDSRGNPTYRKDSFGKMRLLDEIPEIVERYAAWRLGSNKFIADHRGFILPSNNVTHSIFIPRYYNPEIEAEIKRLSHEYKFVPMAELVTQHAISIETGIEIGKMAYGTGLIPFIRTSDISNWEIKADFKHGVSDEIYESFRNKIDVQAGDILMVKDGTYLVGSSAIVTDSDLPMLFQSHLYRIRVLKQDVIDPWLLFVLLNTPIVRLQVKAKQFTQDIIDTLGMRILEIALPIPRNNTRSNQVSDDCKRIIEMRIKLRGDVSKLVASIGSIE
jgi:type I restriction enzyme M protein